MRARLVFAAVGAFIVIACSSSSSTERAFTSNGGAGDASASSGLDAASGASDANANDQTDASSIDGGGCGEFTGDQVFTCSKDGNSRGKCPDGVTLTVETCARGCLRSDDASQDSTCMTTTDNWSCTGSYSTVKSTSGDYYLTSFGCWTDASGTVHTDPGDNCIPGCLAQAQNAGLCNGSGPACEELLTWYTADSGRFGCLARVRITNPATGAAVVAIVLDAGPSCSSVEDQVDKGVLDASGRVDLQLFGGDEGYSDKALVHVVEVDSSTPLGVVSE